MQCVISFPKMVFYKIIPAYFVKCVKISVYDLVTIQSISETFMLLQSKPIFPCFT